MKALGPAICEYTHVWVPGNSYGKKMGKGFVLQNHMKLDLGLARLKAEMIGIGVPSYNSPQSSRQGTGISWNYLSI